MDIAIQEVSYEASIKWWGLLANNNIHISSIFIKNEGFYKTDEKDKFFIIKSENISFSIRVCFSNKSKSIFVVPNKLNLNKDELSLIIETSKNISKQQKFRHFCIILACSNSVDELHNLGYESDIWKSEICFTHSIKYNQFTNKRIAKHQILRWLPISEVRIIKKDTNDFKQVIKLLNEWIKTKEIDGDSADEWGNFAFNTVINDIDNFELLGVFINNTLISYRAYRKLGDKTMFIMLENVVNSKMSCIEEIISDVDKTYRNYYNISGDDTNANRMIRFNAKTLSLYLYEEYNKLYNKNIEYYNIDSTGGNDNLFIYKQRNFEIMTNVLRIKIK